MYGAILGDMIGSPFEFDRGDKTKEFDLFSRGCQFTDDSVMTAAVAEALIEAGPDASREEIEEAVIIHLQDWGKRYPDAGYGGRFYYWLENRDPKPYHHVESCQQTVPEAIIAFLESEDYEDAVRNAVSLGGDTDTLGAITGSIAEAYYDMPAVLRAECRSRVSEDILGVMQLFDEVIGRRSVDSEEYEENLKTDEGETEWNEQSE